MSAQLKGFRLTTNEQSLANALTRHRLPQWEGGLTSLSADMRCSRGGAGDAEEARMQGGLKGRGSPAQHLHGAASTHSEHRSAAGGALLSEGCLF